MFFRYKINYKARKHHVNLLRFGRKDSIIMSELFDNAEIKDYNGFELREFEFLGRRADIISPACPTPDKKWIWRAEFLGAFDYADIEMLKRGYYLVYYRISNLYGCPKAVSYMKDFYDFLTGEMHFDTKTILFGFSRGGLYSVNFALKYPELVRALYLDAPVLDIKSWPGGLGVGLGAEREYEECLECYGLDRSTALSFKDNPIDNAEKLAVSGIPVVIVAGDSDADVPHRENAQLLYDIYMKNGAKILYILKKGCDHHPHSLEDPTQICDFLASC